MLVAKRILNPGHLLPVVSSLTILCCSITLSLLASPLHAANWYVKPSAEVPIRSGKGTEYKILAVIPDGMKVELVEEEDPWAMVRTEGGTEGWMLKRYLSTDPPLSEAVASLTEQKNRLATKAEETEGKYNELADLYSQNEQELNACIAERDKIRTDYQTLKKDTADVIRIKESLTTKTQEVQDLTQKLTNAQQEVKNLKSRTALKWFLSGAFVLFIGWIIGVLSSRSGRRKSSLY